MRRKFSGASFNSHAPVGARYQPPHLAVGDSVSIHTPPWGRDCRTPTETTGSQFQFTRPRGGAMTSLMISLSTSLFQFTRPRGGAIGTTCSSRSRRSFNSHAPVGARWNKNDVPARYSVSIHTPPWGRDFLRNGFFWSAKFQFTRPRGGAITRQGFSGTLNKFQFTRPRGGAIQRGRLLRLHAGFNSHAPVGARLRYKFQHHVIEVSIHTPPWGRDYTYNNHIYC